MIATRTSVSRALLQSKACRCAVYLRGAPCHFRSQLICFEPVQQNAALEGFIETQVEDNALIDPGIPRATRAKMRKSFPRHAPDIARVDCARVAAWSGECSQQRMVASTWNLDGFRWRRAARRVSREYTTRLLAHTGVTPGVCDQCQSRAVSSHVAYLPMEAPRFAHYCDVCAANAAPGWLAVATFNTK